jgi:hypothetical protein
LTHLINLHILNLSKINSNPAIQLQCDHPSSTKFTISHTKPIIIKHSTLYTYWKHLRFLQQVCKRFITFLRCDAVLMGDVFDRSQCRQHNGNCSSITQHHNSQDINLLPITLCPVSQRLPEHSYNKSQQDALFLNFILVKNSTCFRQIYCPSSGVLILYSQQYVCHTSYVDCLLA